MRHYLFIIAIFFTIAISFSCSTQSKDEQSESKAIQKQLAADTISELEKSTAMVGDLAPNFDLVDSEGKRITLGDYRGKFVVLEWTNFDCPYVQKLYDNGTMQKLQKDYRAKKVAWLTICSTAPGDQGYFTGKDLENELKKMNWDGNNYLIDQNKKAAGLYKVSTTPEIYIVNKQGILVYAGAVDDEAISDNKNIPYSKNYVAQALDDALLGNQVQLDSTEPYGCPLQY